MNCPARFIGNDRSKWRTNVPTYAKVKYEDVYPGVDLVYYGNQRQMEYDFVIAPNADPTVIAFDLANLSRSETGPWIDGKGDLVISTAAGEVRFHKPVVYQSADNSDKRLVEGKFVLKGEKRVAFEVAEYDRTKTLVIDPVLVYSTPLAGNDEDDGNGIAVDAAGSAYVTGFTVSTVFPTTAGVFNSSGPGAFVTKFSPDGTSLVYSTFIGSGTGGSSIAVDGSGSAYITGSAGDNLPLVNPAQTNYGGNQDAFLAKLNADGSTLLYSTYLGGSASDEGSGIAILGPGSALVTGKTVSTDFPTFNALQSASAGADDAFVAKIDTTKVGSSSLIFSTYLGGSDLDSGRSIAVDGSGNAYVTGETQSSDFPTTVNAFQGSPGGSLDGFVAKISADGSSLLYSTYLGGSSSDEARGIAVFGSDAYVTGAASPGFPTVNALQSTALGQGDAFVAKLDTVQSGAASLLYSSYLGGTGLDFWRSDRG